MKEKMAAARAAKVKEVGEAVGASNQEIEEVLNMLEE
jgi:hypothetical protein